MKKKVEKRVNRAAKAMAKHRHGHSKAERELFIGILK